MLQVKTFKLPEQEDDANEFLQPHIPEVSISFNKDPLFIGYDDGAFSPAAEIGVPRSAEARGHEDGPRMHLHLRARPSDARVEAPPRDGGQRLTLIFCLPEATTQLP
jgi:hypothetical protein